MTSNHESDNIVHDEKKDGWVQHTISFLFIGTIVIGFIYLGLNFYRYREMHKPTTPEEILAEKINTQFSSWDGSHLQLSKFIKKNMNDPSSYEHVKTYRYQQDDHIVIETKYREKNTFGALILNSVKAKCDLGGNVIEIISQKN